MASVKGKLFEFFVQQMLLSCGFRPITPDGLLIYRGGAGMMIQGLGQPHNADVLLAPPFQTPFYFPTRLLVECKCYEESIGLPIIRNALGLREDINHFDIVTEEILKNRRDKKWRGKQYYYICRYHYQVAVASTSGFKSTAAPFAQAHRIPLISFSSSMFLDIRQLILSIEREALNDEAFSETILHALNLPHQPFYQFADLVPNNNLRELFLSFIDNVQTMCSRAAVGLLENGTILFLLRAQAQDCCFYQKSYYQDGFTLHWGESPNLWVLQDRDEKYYFELPREILRQWKDYEGNRKEAALHLKQDTMSEIVLFSNSLGQSQESCNIRLLRLSSSFIEDAKQALRTASQ